MVGKYAIPNSVSGQIFLAFMGVLRKLAQRSACLRQRGMANFAGTQVTSIIFVTYSVTKRAITQMRNSSKETKIRMLSLTRNKKNKLLKCVINLDDEQKIYYPSYLQQQNQESHQQE